MNEPDELVSSIEEHALNRLCNIINSWATSKGWNETPDSVQHKAEQIALMHSELSECLEFLRKPNYSCCPNCKNVLCYSSQTDMHTCSKCNTVVHRVDILIRGQADDHVPSLTGESAELADVLIRIFHYCGKRNINLGEAVRLKHEYNITRPYKHGKHM